MFQMQQLMGSADIADLASTYLSNLYQIKIASFNKKEYDKVYKEVTKNGGLNEYAITDSGRVIVMDEGKIIADEVPNEVGKILKSQNHDMYKALPTPMRVHGEVKNTLSCPLTVRDGRTWLEEYSKETL